MDPSLTVEMTDAKVSIFSSDRYTDFNVWRIWKNPKQILVT